MGRSVSRLCTRVLVAGTVVAVALLAMNTAAASTPAGAALDQHGKAHAWRGATGEHVVVDFAASWCAPCQKTLPALQAYADAHPKLKILVVSVDEDPAGRDRLVSGLGLRLPVLWDDGYAIAEHYRPAGMPATFVLDPQGEIVYSHVGSGKEDWAELVELLDRIAPANSPSEARAED